MPARVTNKLDSKTLAAIIVHEIQFSIKSLIKKGNKFWNKKGIEVGKQIIITQAMLALLK